MKLMLSWRHLNLRGSLVAPTLLAVAVATPAQAAVSFAFDYTGSVEFNDPGLGAARRAALESAATVVGGWFQHTATVTMQVSSSNANNTTLASAGSNIGPPTPGFNNSGFVRNRILTGLGNLGGPDGTVEVNFFHNWDLDDSIDPAAFDFKATMIHELLHATGWASLIEQNGTDIAGNPAGTPGGSFSNYDRFLTNAAGEPIVDTVTFTLNGPRWNAASIGGAGAGVFFAGPNAVAGNGGVRVPLFSPNPWQDGSSVGHLDDAFFTAVDLLMESATTPGPSARTLSAREIGVLRDIGYTIIPEPGAGLFCLVAMVGFLRRRRA